MDPSRNPSIARREGRNNVALSVDTSAKKWVELDRKTGFAGCNDYAGKMGKVGDK
jgi:hypothetical protein